MAATQGFSHYCQPRCWGLGYGRSIVGSRMPDSKGPTSLLDVRLSRTQRARSEGVRGFTSEVAATVGGDNVRVLGAVAQGQFVGLDQINIGPLPRTLTGRGEVNMVLTVDGKPANTVKVNVR